MKVGTRLLINNFHIHKVEYGNKNKVNVDGTMLINPEVSKELMEKEPLIKDISIRIIKPDEHNQYTNTIMDVIPISTKALGEVGEGITNTLSGVYIILTGIDESGRQVCNAGASNGILKDKVAWGRAGTPLESDILISFDVVVKEGSWTERAGPMAIHKVCDRFCQIFRMQMKKFTGKNATEKVVHEEEYIPGNKDIVIVKEVSGQGAVYETSLFGNEPCGYQGGCSVIDMQWMPVVLTPNEYRDGILHALD